MYITPQLRQLTDNTVVDVSPQGCLLYCRHSLCNFFHIVDFNAGKNGNGLHEESLLMFRLRHIIEIQNQIPVSIAEFIRQALIHNPILAIIDGFIKISGLPPNPINIQIFHSLVNPFIFLNGSPDPIEKDTVCPAQSGIFVDNRNAYGQILNGIRRRLIDTLRNSVKISRNFTVPFCITFMCQNRNAGNQNTCQSGNNPVIYGNQRQQNQYHR